METSEQKDKSPLMSDAVKRESIDLSNSLLNGIDISALPNELVIDILKKEKESMLALRDSIADLFIEYDKKKSENKEVNNAEKSKKEIISRSDIHAIKDMFSSIFSVLVQSGHKFATEEEIKAMYGNRSNFNDIFNLVKCTLITHTHEDKIEGYSIGLKRRLFDGSVCNYLDFNKVLDKSDR